MALTDKATRVDETGPISVLKVVEGDGEGFYPSRWTLLDTGRTAAKVREMLPKAHFATIYAKPAGKHWWILSSTEVLS